MTVPKEVRVLVNELQELLPDVVVEKIERGSSHYIGTFKIGDRRLRHAIPRDTEYRGRKNWLSQIRKRLTQGTTQQ